MAKRMMTILLVACCMVVTVCGLVGCSISKDAFVGTWTLESGSEESLDSASVELMKSLGYDVSLTLNEDGTGTLVLIGEEKPVSWEAKSASEGSVTIGDNAGGSLTASDGKLVIADSAGLTMTFVRVQDEASISSDEAGESSASASAAEGESGSTASASEGGSGSSASSESGK